jgi:hypothetical protein
MARATRETVHAMLCAEGATPTQADRIIEALEQSGLNPPAMRIWLDHPDRAYPVSTGLVVDDVEFKQVSTHAIEAGHAQAVIAAAESFAAATPEERLISQTLLCELEAVRRLTHGDDERTALVLEIAAALKAVLRKEVHVNAVLQQMLSGSFEGDQTRLVDWMLDERLADAAQAISSRRLDPTALHQQDALGFWGW